MKNKFQGHSYTRPSRHVPIHKFDNFFYKSVLHFPTGIHMYICSMVKSTMYII